MTRIVILNSPPRSGKDSIADLLVEKNSYQKRAFKDKLFEIALLVSGVTIEEWGQRYAVAKEEPWSRLGGLSQRNYLIKISEEWVKPLHGQDYFGRMLAESITSDDYYVIPDGGFEHEIQPVLDRHGEQSILILQWTRFDHDFSYDSRNWINNYPSITKRIRDNNTTIEEHYDAVLTHIKKHFNE